MGNKSVEVVMVPFPEQSHLNQLLQLSHVISSHNIKVHFVASDLHISQVRSRAATDPNPNPNLHFHGLPTPDFPSPPPSHTQFPTHLIPCFEATADLRQPTKSLLSSLSQQASKLVIIHDPMMSFVVQDSAELTNAEPYVYYCISAISHFVMIRDALGLKAREDVPSPGADADLPELHHFVQKQVEVLGRSKRSGILYNTCRVLDGEFLDLILEKEREADEKIEMWAFGPLETVTRSSNERRLRTNGASCLEWLDEQEPGSVLYVSFGTTTFMENAQIQELASGLERSLVKFVWVLRDADRANVFDQNGGARRPELPLGFEERMERTGMGIVVREWAPQLEILGHSSTGGFMSHCGWNSVLESLSLGVPLVAWPMHSDQPTNAFLVTEILKVGLSVREWAKRDEAVSRSVISEAVKRLMGKDQSGNEIRKRAQELGCELRKCAGEGGLSRLELDSFLAHITRA